MNIRRTRKCEKDRKDHKEINDRLDALESNLEEQAKLVRELQIEAGLYGSDLKEVDRS